jgi:hypothetical protein
MTAPALSFEAAPADARIGEAHHERQISRHSGSCSVAHAFLTGLFVFAGAISQSVASFAAPSTNDCSLRILAICIAVAEGPESAHKGSRRPSADRLPPTQLERPLPAQTSA